MAPGGSSGWTSASLSRASDQTGVGTLTLSLSSTRITEIPACELDEMTSTSGSVRRASSTGSVTRASTRSGVAPGNGVSTVATRFMTRGSSVVGRAASAASPATSSRAQPRMIRRGFSTVRASIGDQLRCVFESNLLAGRQPVHAEAGADLRR